MLSNKKFAKLYEDENLGQILVKIDSAEDDGYEAEVRIYFEPKGLGVCSTVFSYDSWDGAEEAFDKVDQELCVKLIEPLLKQLGGLADD